MTHTDYSELIAILTTDIAVNGVRNLTNKDLLELLTIIKAKKEEEENLLDYALGLHTEY